jgi:hypothetical protein
LTISGPEADLQRFKECAKGKESGDGQEYVLDANKFIPMPDSLNIESGSQDVLYDVWFGKMPEVEWLPKDREAAKGQLRKEYKERKEPLDADKIAEQYKFNVDNYGCKTWYEWHLRYWGCKWNFSEPSLREENGALIYAFSSAWSPMIPVIRKMGEMFPMLRFEMEYDEESHAFVGKFVVWHGMILEDESHEPAPEEYMSEEEIAESMEEQLQDIDDHLAESGEKGEELRHQKKGEESMLPRYAHLREGNE